MSFEGKKSGEQTIVSPWLDQSRQKSQKKREASLISVLFRNYSLAIWKKKKIFFPFKKENEVDGFDFLTSLITL